MALGLPDEAVGRVVSVISGDSLGIEMLIADAGANGVDSIKLADIAAPSTITAEGKAAQSYSLSLLKNKMVYLDINNNTSIRRNKWNQLVCVIYLVDPEFRPVWPPVNRIIVDNGYAKRNDNPNDEFNSSAWWQKPPVFLPSKKSDQLTAIIEKRVHPEQMFFVEPLPSPADVVPINSTSIAAKDSYASNSAKEASANIATNNSSDTIAAKVTLASDKIRETPMLGVKKGTSSSNAAKVTPASNKTREIPMLGVKKGTSSSNAAKVTLASDKIRETSQLGAKRSASSSNAARDTSASLVVPANSSPVAYNDTTVSLGIPLNSTSRFVMENATSHQVLVNTTSRVVPGVSKSNEAKRDSRSGSILEKDAASGRISIGYRK
jgi:hypothetical protein